MLRVNEWEDGDDASGSAAATSVMLVGNLGWWWVTVGRLPSSLRLRPLISISFRRDHLKFLGIYLVRRRLRNLKHQT